MALGKAAKQKRNLSIIIKPKLEAKISSKEYKDEFKKLVNKQTVKKFKMYVYGHELLNGAELTKEEWLKWINEYNKLNN